MEGGAAIAWAHVAFAAAYGGLATQGVWSAAELAWGWVVLRVVSFLLTLAASVSAVLATVHGLRDAAILQALVAVARFAVTAARAFPRHFDPALDQDQRQMAAFAFALAASLSAAGLVPIAVACARDYPAPKDARLSRGLLVSGGAGLGAAALLAASEVVRQACDGLCVATLVLDWLAFAAVPLLAPTLHLRQAVAVSQTIAFLAPSVLVMLAWLGAAAAAAGAAVHASSPLESGGGGARLGLQAAGCCVGALAAVLFFAINTSWFRARWVLLPGGGGGGPDGGSGGAGGGGEGERETDTLLRRQEQQLVAPVGENGASMKSLASHVQYTHTGGVIPGSSFAYSEQKQ